MSFEVVVVRVLIRKDNYKHSQVLLLSQYQKEDVNYPIIREGLNIKDWTLHCPLNEQILLENCPMK